MNIDDYGQARVLIQGIGEPAGSYYATRMSANGTKILAGVGIGRGGEKLGEIPIFELVETAIACMGRFDISAIFVPPERVLDAAREAMHCGIGQLIIVTPRVPPLDSIALIQEAKRTQTLLLGMGSRGIILPGCCAIGTYPSEFYRPGRVALLGRLGHFSDEIALMLARARLGVAIAVHLGSDELLGSLYEPWLVKLEQSAKVEAIVLLGRQDRIAEAMAAKTIAQKLSKPVIAYLVGENFPEGRILPASLPLETPSSSPVEALQGVNVKVCGNPGQLIQLLQEVL